MRRVAWHLSRRPALASLQTVDTDRMCSSGVLLPLNFLPQSADCSRRRSHVELPLGSTQRAFPVSGNDGASVIRRLEAHHKQGERVRDSIPPAMKVRPASKAERWEAAVTKARDADLCRWFCAPTLPGRCAGPFCASDPMYRPAAIGSGTALRRQGLGVSTLRRFRYPGTYEGTSWQ
jgi:hypothetical protein